MNEFKDMVEKACMYVNSWRCKTCGYYNPLYATDKDLRESLRLHLICTKCKNEVIIENGVKVQIENEDMNV